MARVKEGLHRASQRVIDVWAQQPENVAGAKKQVRAMDEAVKGLAAALTRARKGIQATRLTRRDNPRACATCGHNRYVHEHTRKRARDTWSYGTCLIADGCTQYKEATNGTTQEQLSDGVFV